MSTLLQAAGPAKYGRRYPWEKWFRRKRFTAHAGVDFNGRAYTFAQQVRNAASAARYNVRVQVKVSEDEQTVTVVVLSPLAD